MAKESRVALFQELDTSLDADEDDARHRFVMDFSMFRVAKQLRLLGYDCVCDKRLRQQELLAVAVQQRRVLVSGSRSLAPQVDRYNKEIDRRRRYRQQAARGGARRPRRVVGYNSDGESEYASSDVSEEEEEPHAQMVQVRATDPHDTTLSTIMERMSLVWDASKIFTRCVTCNRLIKNISRALAEPLVHPTVFKVYRNFYQCPVCSKVYWGVDNGVIVNYKALRTIEYLKRYTSMPQVAGAPPAAPADDADAGADGSVSGSAAPAGAAVSLLGVGGPSSLRTFRRHFLSYPRAVKCIIFDFLDGEDLQAAADAFPMLSELIDVVRRGDSRKFVPEWKMKDKEQRRPPSGGLVVKRV